MNRQTILHVEDDPNDVVLLDHAFRKAGVDCEIKRVADGEEAIAYLAGEEKFADRQLFPIPRLILLDLKMPHLSGFDVLHWRRENEKIKSVPVVILSSSNHDVDLTRAYELGVNSYLIKPVGFEPLVRLVEGVHRFWCASDAVAGS